MGVNSAGFQHLPNSLFNGLQVLGRKRTHTLFQPLFRNSANPDDGQAQGGRG
jgi:hypothetical protein